MHIKVDKRKRYLWISEPEMKTATFPLDTQQVYRPPNLKEIVGSTGDTSTVVIVESNF
jgi:hypothetical protein